MILEAITLFLPFFLDYTIEMSLEDELLTTF